MSTDEGSYRERVEQNLAALRVHIAKLGIQFDFSAEIDLPEPDEPLAELFAYLKIIQGNLRELHEAQQQAIAELDQRVMERTKELEAKVATIRAQSQAIVELSTPAMLLWDAVLTLPLIGCIDTQRGKQITENLLAGIVAHQAEVAIIDVTGVPFVDTAVASHLIDAMRAARLLGATVILAGLSPANAQALIRLGVDLDEIETRGTLQKALVRALDLVGRQICVRH